MVEMLFTELGRHLAILGILRVEQLGVRAQALIYQVIANFGMDFSWSERDRIWQADCESQREPNQFYWENLWR